MKRSPAARSQANPWPLALLPLGVAVFLLELAAAHRTPVWLDEAHTHWLVRGGVGTLFERLAADVHPPVYYCLTSWVTDCLGIEPWALRLVSILAATLMVPAAYWTARAFTSPRGAFAATTLVVTHPLFVYYGYEARNYALLLLWLMLVIGALFRVADDKAGTREWLTFTVLLMLLLNTHNLALFVLPSVFLGGIWLARQRWKTFGPRLLAAMLVAFATYLPWFFRALHAEGGISWLSAFWTEPLKWTAPLRSLMAFGVGSEFPRHLGPVGNIVGLPVLGGGITVLLLLASWARTETSGGTKARSIPAATVVGWMGGLSLLLLWLYSLSYRPIYLVGRYDLIAFPFAALLLFMGIRALKRLTQLPVLAGTVLALCLGLNLAESVQLWSKAQVDAPPSPAPTVAYFARASRPGDLILTRGNIAYLIVGYAADRTGHRLSFTPFPAEMAQHPGWYEPKIFLRDKARLQADADMIAQKVTTAFSSGHRVWLLDDGDPGVDAFLIARLQQVAVPDTINSSQAAGVIALRPSH